MMEILLILLGVGAGILIGLIPGFHINNLIPFFIFLPFTNPQFFFFIIAVSVAYVFSSIFPGVLLGIPNEDTALIVLPGHRLVLEGKAYNALILSIYGCFFALLFSTFFLFFFWILMPTLYSALKFAIPFILLLIIFILIFLDRLPALIIISLSGILGILTFNLNLLLPLLTGFFGMSTLLISLFHDTKLPKQTIKFEPNISRFQILRASFISTFFGSIFNTLPAVSSSITALIGKVFGKMKSEEFLVFIGGTNITYMIFSFFAFVFIGRTRSGSAVFLSKIFNQEHVLFLAGIILVSGVVSALVCLKISVRLVEIYRKVDYRKMTVFAMFFLIIVVTVFTGFLGLLVFFTSTCIGLACNYLRVKRINCMASLIIPTIIVLM